MLLSVVEHHRTFQCAPLLDSARNASEPLQRTEATDGFHLAVRALAGYRGVAAAGAAL